MYFIYEIMKMPSHELLKMDKTQLLFLQDHLQDLRQKIDLTSRALDNIKSLKDDLNAH